MRKRSPTQGGRCRRVSQTNSSNPAFGTLGSQRGASPSVGPNLFIIGFRAWPAPPPAPLGLRTHGEGVPGRVLRGTTRDEPQIHSGFRVGTGQAAQALTLPVRRIGTAGRQQHQCSRRQPDSRRLPNVCHRSRKRGGAALLPSHLALTRNRSLVDSRTGSSYSRAKLRPASELTNECLDE